MTPQEREAICQRAREVAAEAPLPTPEQVVTLRRLLGIDLAQMRREQAANLRSQAGDR